MTDQQKTISVPRVPRHRPTVQQQRRRRIIQSKRSDTRYGALIFAVDTKRFCMVKQKESKFIGFAKGHADANETGIKCVIREVKEETGIDLTRSYFCSPLSHRGSFYLYPIHLERECVATPRDTNEIEACLWLTYEELIALPKEQLSKPTQYFITKIKKT